MRRVTLVFVVLVLGGICPAWGSFPADPAQPAVMIEPPPLDEPGQKAIKLPVPTRGQLLYENHCMACHESVVHVRTQQQVESLPALQVEVRRWATHMQLRWGNEEVEDVVDYLDHQYYKFESR